jgi:hypothetical protein
MSDGKLDMGGMFKKDGAAKAELDRIKSKQKKSKRYGKAVSYDFPAELINEVRKVGQSLKAPNNGYAILLMLEGLRQAENIDANSYLTETKSRAYLHGWDYEKMEAELVKIIGDV